MIFNSFQPADKRGNWEAIELEERPVESKLTDGIFGGAASFPAPAFLLGQNGQLGCWHRSFCRAHPTAPKVRFP